MRGDGARRTNLEPMSLSLRQPVRVKAPLVVGCGECLGAGNGQERKERGTIIAGGLDSTALGIVTGQAVSLWWSVVRF